MSYAEVLELKRNPKLKEFIENDPHRHQFSRARWAEWEKVYWEDIAPIMKQFVLVNHEIYVSAQDYWLRSGLDEAIDYLERYAHMC